LGTPEAGAIRRAVGDRVRASPFTALETGPRPPPRVWFSERLGESPTLWPRCPQRQLGTTHQVGRRWRGQGCCWKATWQGTRGRGLSQDVGVWSFSPSPAGHCPPPPGTAVLSPSLGSLRPRPPRCPGFTEVLHLPAWPPPHPALPGVRRGHTVTREGQGLWTSWEHSCASSHLACLLRWGLHR
jgi:hypothetical protein